MDAWWQEPHHVWRMRPWRDVVFLPFAYLSLLLFHRFPGFLSLGLSSRSSLLLFLPLFLFSLLPFARLLFGATLLLLLLFLLLLFLLSQLPPVLL